MKKYYIIFFLSLIIFTTIIFGCSRNKEFYVFNYSPDTFLPQLDHLFLYDVKFTDPSNETTLDLPVFTLNGEQQSYILNYPLTLAKDLNTGQIYTIPETLQGKLLLHKEALNLSIFGEALDWQEVDNIFPIYSKAIVRDLVTQLTYRVQRRGGNLHADVQPLLRLDTEKMLRAYNNKWSWDRRAVVLRVGERFIAGSINGMPHGLGSIRHNDFDGHSCIHFLNSRVHGSNKVDFAHQLMVSKASGQLFYRLMGMDPEDILKAFITFSTQNQEHLNKYILFDPDYDLSFFQSLQSIHLGNINLISEDIGFKKLEVEAMYYLDNKRHEEKLIFEFYKSSYHLTWKIRPLK